MESTPAPKPNAASAPQPALPTPTRSRLRWWHIALILLIALPTITAGIVYWLWKSPPSHWSANQQQLAARSPEELRAMGEDLERRVTTDLSRVRPSTETGPDDRTVRVTLEEANAWISTRLEHWLKNRRVKLPSEIKQPMIAANHSGQIILAVQANLPQTQQVLSAILDTGVQPDGKLRVQLVGLRSGSLPVPMALASRVGSSLPPEQAHVAGQFQQIIQGLTLEPITRLDDARNVRLTGFKATPEAIELNFRTEPRPRKGK